MCEEVKGGIDLFVIMETFWRTNRQKDMEDWVLLEKRRERESKRGGGIMMIGKGQQELKEIQTEGEDILACEWRIRGTKIVLVGVYWDVREKRKNVECKKEIERILSEYRDEAVVIVGDMNAHLESLDGRKNVNTEVLEDLLTENALVCVNLTEKCEGKWTWESRGTKTAIDYCMVNQAAWERVREMKIDEEKVLDISDHNKCEVVMMGELGGSEVGLESKEGEAGQRRKAYDLYNQKKLAKFKEEMCRNTSWRNMEEMEREVVRGMEGCLRRGDGRRRGRRNKPWFDEHLRKMIAERRNLNKRRRKDENEIEKEHLRMRYELSLIHI